MAPRKSVKKSLKQILSGVAKKDAQDTQKYERLLVRKMAKEAEDSADVRERLDAFNPEVQKRRARQAREAVRTRMDIEEAMDKLPATERISHFARKARAEAGVEAQRNMMPHESIQQRILDAVKDQVVESVRMRNAQHLSQAELREIMQAETARLMDLISEEARLVRDTLAGDIATISESRELSMGKKPRVPPSASASASASEFRTPAPAGKLDFGEASASSAGKPAYASPALNTAFSSLPVRAPSPPKPSKKGKEPSPTGSSPQKKIPSKK